MPSSSDVACELPLPRVTSKTRLPVDRLPLARRGLSWGGRERESVRAEEMRRTLAQVRHDGVVGAQQDGDQRGRRAFQRVGQHPQRPPAVVPPVPSLQHVRRALCHHRPVHSLFSVDRSVRLVVVALAYRLRKQSR